MTRARQERVEALYRAHSAAIRARLRWFGLSGATLEDLHQEVFVIVLRRVEDIPEDASAWLVQVARWVITNHRRRRRNISEVLDAEAGMGAPALAEDVELRELVRRGLEELGDAERQLVIRHDLHGETVVEISGELGLTTRRGYGRLYAGRERLRRIFLDDE
ncbi:sigma-70 family RNA polymerase sigma factor [Polyangium sp. 6x1]|uniref:RNA polymerase sigma factor n=1 Tax=Polyangium sp. 6x1 TaxID=3042689 RepID=UPI00248287E7|nr:sigma-70 family RNA polymerase sigma factor [Polyangium sp. 6x1]MDI1450797.1 sigma-70 family RNA polymerase sigma factor [Polyangium sp. 6x1]